MNHSFIKKKQLLLLISQIELFMFDIFHFQCLIRFFQQNKQLIRKQEQKMHNPAKKIPKTIRNQLVPGTALVIGREWLERPKSKQARLRETKNARSIIAKEKLISKFEQIHLDFGELKIDGKQINSAFALQSFKNKNKLKSNQNTKPFRQDHVAQTESTTQKEKTRKISKKQDLQQSTSKSYQNILTDNAGQKQNSSQDNKVLPEIFNNKQVATNVQQKKSYQYRSSQRHVKIEISPNKVVKRRDTVVQTSSNYKQKIKNYDEVSKNKPQFKKTVNLHQFRQFLLTITLSNQLIIFPQEQVQYKAYICKGNNGLLLKSIIKTRPWWSFRTSSEIDSCNLVWTEWKRNKSINQLTLHNHKDKIEKQVEFSLNIKTKNKEIKQKMQKKFTNFERIVGNNKNLCLKYDDSILSQNYLNFTTKLNNKTFEDTVQKSLQGETYSIYPKNNQRKIANHIPGCLYLHSKKLLFLSISKYYQKLQKDVFSIIPMTFLISKGLNDPEFQRFCKYFDECASKNKNQKKNSPNIWICKPGQNSNRGHGIQVVSSIAEIRSLISQKCGPTRTLIIQKYIQNPYLYNKRKFDIRCYVLITCVNGCVKGYWYEQGYVRTTSEVYTLKNLDNKLIHLTNDAIQKKGEEYGKFQNFNKVSFAELQKYIENNTEYKFNVVYQKIKTIARQLIESVATKINPKHKQFCFQVFGLDFMLDDKLNPYLIEANSNPCLEVDGNVLGKVIPKMIENVIRVAIDPIFPPPYSETIKNRFTPGSTFENNRFVLVYDSLHYDSSSSKEEGDLVEAAQQECEQFQGQIQQQ